MNSKTQPPTGSTTTESPSNDNDIVVIKLGLFWDEWARCLGSRYQGDHLYRTGRFDSCARQWKDLKTATQARFLVGRDPQTARRLLESTYYKKRTTISPTAGAIWEMKERPGWD
mmetsp:Transcript_20498/g.38356  ORF Transcript_20498/g.38356 Transcript_20498/m.38356 type:complete len:114 (-) Transcript_20498:142-483(-)